MIVFRLDPPDYLIKVLIMSKLVKLSVFVLSIFFGLASTQASAFCNMQPGQHSAMKSCQCQLTDTASADKNSKSATNKECQQKHQEKSKQDQNVKAPVDSKTSSDDTKSTSFDANGSEGAHV